MIPVADLGSDFTGAFKFMGDHMSLLLTEVAKHLEITGITMAIALAIAVPLGVWLGHIKRFSFIAINVSNVGRALPSLAVISLILPATGVTQTTVIIALVILAVPPVLTNTYVAISQVDPDAVEAAKGMGMKPLGVLLRVEMPLAIPLIFAGIRTATVYVIATATLGGFFGGGGLGEIIANQASYRFTGVLAASIWVAVLAILAELLLGFVQYLLTPRGLRAGEGGAPTALVPSTEAA
jgi:osmoprotectant transport system permease protein